MIRTPDGTLHTAIVECGSCGTMERVMLAQFFAIVCLGCDTRIVMAPDCSECDEFFERGVYVGVKKAEADAKEKAKAIAKAKRRKK